MSISVLSDQAQVKGASTGTVGRRRRRRWGVGAVVAAAIVALAPASRCRRRRLDPARRTVRRLHAPGFTDGQLRDADRVGQWLVRPPAHGRVLVRAAGPRWPVPVGGDACCFSAQRAAAVACRVVRDRARLRDVVPDTEHRLAVARRAVRRQPRGDPLRRRDLRVRDWLGQRRVVSDVGVGMGPPRWQSHLEPGGHDRWHEHVPHRSGHRQRHVGQSVLGVGMVRLELARQPADLVRRRRVPVRCVVRLREEARTKRSWYGRLQGGAWTGWTSLGGVAMSAPAATEDPIGGVDVFVVGLDGSMCRAATRWAARLLAVDPDRRARCCSHPGAGGTQVFAA